MHYDIYDVACRIYMSVRVVAEGPSSLILSMCKKEEGLDESRIVPENRLLHLPLLECSAVGLEQQQQPLPLALLRNAGLPSSKEGTAICACLEGATQVL